MPVEKIGLLRQTHEGFGSGGEVRGVIKIYESDGKVKLKASVVNLDYKNGDEFYFLYVGNKYYVFPFFNLSVEYILDDGERNSGAVALIKVENGEVLPVAYLDLNGGKVSEKEIIEIAKENITACDFASKKESDNVFGFQEYDDEQIATENYFEFADKGEVNARQNYENENSRNEDFEKEKGGEYAGGEDDKNRLRKREFFKSIEGEIDEIFSSHERYYRLENTVRNSKWVKINYDENRHYVVGLLYDNDAIAYLCYGVPGKYGEKPRGFEDKCQFLPISFFDLKGDGYYVIFQDSAK